MKWFPLTPILLAMSALSPAEEATRTFFPGGPSEIGSDDPDRAEKAVRKWSDPDGSEEDLAGEPWFWDFSKVGRPLFLRVLKNGNRTGLIEAWLENPETGRFELFKSYRVAYFSGDPGPKTKVGDLQAPEGFYFLSRGRMNPASSYHLSLDMGYPNAHDRARGYTGSALMIHGKAVSLGCFAMTDSSIEQIYTLVDAALRGGQGFVRVHSFPFAMTRENLEKHEDSEHIGFWRNLKEGWDHFEERRRPPNVEVEGGRYIFSES